MGLENLIALTTLASLILYALLGGADFGAGVWDLFASNRRAARQRQIIGEAIGPIWEANHVWLIIAVTILFTAFPTAFALITTALHIPLTLMLLGIVLRGTAFAVRTHDITSQTDGSSGTLDIWHYLFAGSSMITPALLGISLGAVASGRLTAVSSPGSFMQRFVAPWLAPFPLSVGFLTLVLVAYLAATYLLVEAQELDLRKRFARRAIASCAAVLLAGGVVLWQARDGAPEIYAGLRHTPVGLIAILLASAFHLAALSALWHLRVRAARGCAIGGAVVMFWGWALSQYPFLVEPHLTIAHAAPPPTLRLLLISLVIGSLVLFPLLYYLYRIFKGRVLPGG